MSKFKVFLIALGIALMLAYMHPHGSGSAATSHTSHAVTVPSSLDAVKCGASGTVEKVAPDTAKARELAATYCTKLAAAGR